MINEEILKEIREIIPRERMRLSEADLYTYASDASIHRRKPDLVVQVVITEEVSRLLNLANKYQIPVTPRGAGTAVCGHSVPLKGGIVLDLQLMNRVREIHIEDLYVVVEPGVVYDALNKTLKPYRFFFPPDPGSGEACTIGGMVVCNASGVHAVKYGATRDYVLGLELVLPTGEVAKLGTRTLKSASGYQFERLMPASEGTLGVVTEITLRVVPIPAAKAMAVAAFDVLEAAGQCVSNIIAYPVLPSALEIMDDICIKAINKAMNLGLPEVEAICFIEVDGHPAQVKEDIQKVAEVARSSGAISVEFTEEAKKINELQKARKGMIPSLSKYRPDLVTVMLADDMAVPISKVPQAIKAFHEIAQRHGVLIPTYGHAGDGNLHTKVLLDPTRKEQWEAGEAATANVFDAVLALGGTVTGEHGIAITKAPFYRRERSDMLEISKAVKRVFDPKNILNPNKIMDWDKGIITHLRYPVPPKETGKHPALQKWEWEMLSCTYCGFCKSVCPVFSQMLVDSSVARGRIALSYGVLEEEIPLDSSVAERLYQCMMCMDCTRRCPSGINVVPVVEAARAELVRAGLCSDGHRALVENIVSSGNIFGDPTSFAPPREGETLIYVGCQFASRINATKMIMRCLEKIGITPRVEHETCCGNPMKILGFEEEFTKQKEKFLQNLKDREVYTLCPTCNMFLREEYHLPVRHILSLVCERLDGTAKKLDMEVTYHDPCHFSRGAGIIREPRDILSSIGVCVKEMEFTGDQSRCCGGGGGVLVSDLPLSDSIARDRVLQADHTGVKTIVTPCPTCETTLRKAASTLSKEGRLEMQVKNLWDLIFQAVR